MYQWVISIKVYIKQESQIVKSLMTMANQNTNGSLTTRKIVPLRADPGLLKCVLTACLDLWEAFLYA